MAALAVTQFTKDLEMSCPACRQPLSGTVSVELSPGEINLGSDKSSVSMTANITGFKIAHDCLPRVTR